jgi:hypothetical protein
LDSTSAQSSDDDENQTSHSLKSVNTATLSVNGKVRALALDHDEYSHDGQLFICTEFETLLVNIEEPDDTNSDILLTIVKTIKRTFAMVCIITDKFFVGYNDNKLEGFLVSSVDDNKLKLNQAFSFNAHRLPITKMYASQGTS